MKMIDINRDDNYNCFAINSRYSHEERIFHCASICRLAVKQSLWD